LSQRSHVTVVIMRTDIGITRRSAISRVAVRLGHPRGPPERTSRWPLRGRPSPESTRDYKDSELIIKICWN
jgi:hypothetical protein